MKDLGSHYSMQYGKCKGFLKFLRANLSLNPKCKTYIKIDKFIKQKEKEDAEVKRELRNLPK